jgi:hypothetical protein
MLLQKLAEICTIGLLLLTVYTSFSDKFSLPLLLAQRYSLLLLIFAFLSLIVVLVSRKHTGKVITLKGTQELPLSYSGNENKVEIEVFYPKPFEHTPNLTIPYITGGFVYRVTEQRLDGFKLEIYWMGDVGFREALPIGRIKETKHPIIKWHAKGGHKKGEHKKFGHVP